MTASTMTGLLYRAVIDEVECPACGAEVGVRCHSQPSGSSRWDPHLVRRRQSPSWQVAHNQWLYSYEVLPAKDRFWLGAKL